MVICRGVHTVEFITQVKDILKAEQSICEVERRLNYKFVKTLKMKKFFPVLYSSL